ncbi:GMC family oxidoreductase [Synechococcus sp. RSCCF101]|uniref:GMC oxidoreductase n=1 Tax=Synechococcus sp. RSCCF101 TaxID=2511069 RepID=UPI0012454B56|nr:GMC family oxidoreductase [Synechococcus sp. RSCCF101]QEY31898.1 GMC family oxidoreductase [Synechococcus sp. RSCCF101]
MGPAGGKRRLSLAELAGETFDAIVVGSGATGGVAAMVLTRGGCRVLVLEAGPALAAAEAFSGEPLNGLRRAVGVASGRHRLQARHPGYWKANPRLYVDEHRHPYETPADAPFLWTRGRQVGGRSLTWGGITLRLSDREFSAAGRDGIGIDWPIRHRDLEPHYRRLERLLGVHGGRDGLPDLPDGDLQPPLPFTPGELWLQRHCRDALGLALIHSRGFRLAHPGLAGWPGSSAQGGALGHALATGRAQLASGAIVARLLLNRSGERAEGVLALERSSGRRHRLRADLVVLCASTIESVRLLLASREAEDSGGVLVDPSGGLGRHLMDHVSTSCFFRLPVGAVPDAAAELSGAGSIFLPDPLLPGEIGAPPFLRHYGLWGAVQRFDPPAALRRHPACASGFLIGHGEVLPDPANRVELSERRDAWGLQVPRITMRWGPNETRMVRHMALRMGQVIEAAGGTPERFEDLFRLPLVEPVLRRAQGGRDGEAAPPGFYIHELGGARMAASEEEGVLDPWNRLWRCPNCLVTDGSCWPSSGWQSPTLTSMALSWRACEQALRRRGERTPA